MTREWLKDTIAIHLSGMQVEEHGTTPQPETLGAIMRLVDSYVAEKVLEARIDELQTKKEQL